jgi:hypothetical protein
MTLGGNTAGVSTLSGSNIVLAGGANVTLSGDGSTVNIIGASGGGSGTEYLFSNGNGVTFGTAGSTVTASVQTAYQSQGAYLTTAQPPGAYLTTAAQSVHTHDYQSTGAYLTTAALSNHVHSLNQIANPAADVLFQFTTGQQVQFQFSNTGTFTTNANKQGLFEIDCQGNLQDGADVLHVHQSDNAPNVDLVHLEGWATGVTALRISASASIAAEINKPIKFVGTGGQTASVPLILQSGQTNSVQYLNANFLQGSQASQFQPTGVYLTTAAQSGHSHGNPTLNLTNLTGTTASNSAGFTLSLSAAAPGAGGGAAISAGTQSQNTGTIIFSDAGGITFGLSAGTLTGTVATNYQSQGAYLTTAANSTHTHSQYLTTARASNDAIGLNSALTANGVSATVNSSGLSLNFPAFLTTAANSTHSHGNPTLALTNITGTTASNSAGLTLSLSAGGGGVTNQTGPNIAVSNTTITSGTVVFANGGNVSFGINGSTITASAPSGGGAAVPNYYAFVGEDYQQARALITNLSAINSRPVFFPFDVGGNLSAGEIHWTMSRSTSGSNSFTVQAGIYSFSNSTRIDLISSTQCDYVQSDTASQSGVRAFEIPCPVTSLTPGQYVLAMNFSAANTASMNYSLMGGTTANLNVVNIVLSGSNAYHTYTSHPTVPFWGRYTANSGGLPSSIAYTHLYHGFTGASAPLPVHFHLVNHY